MKIGSLFAGIGGFDLGLEREGFEIAWQVENDKFCNKLLEAKWPKVQRYGDIREFLAFAVTSPGEIPAADIIVGGDPCPCRSTARGDRPSKHPDLSGYFLAVVGRLRPRWVVRENVPAPDAKDFAVALEAIGYRVVAFALDARDFTSQSRKRQIIIGCPGDRAAGFKRALLDAADGFGFGASHAQETTPPAACATAHPARMAAEDSYVFEPSTHCVTTHGDTRANEGGGRGNIIFEPKTACITTHGKRYDDRDNYIYEPATYCLVKGTGEKGFSANWWAENYLYQGGRLRVLTAEECEALQGLPRGWTAEFSRSRRRAMLGNAIPVPFAEWIGKRIKENIMDRLKVHMIDSTQDKENIMKELPKEIFVTLESADTDDEYLHATEKIEHLDLEPSDHEKIVGKYVLESTMKVRTRLVIDVLR